MKNLLFCLILTLTATSLTTFAKGKEYDTLACSSKTYYYHVQIDEVVPNKLYTETDVRYLHQKHPFYMRDTSEGNMGIFTLNNSRKVKISLNENGGILARSETVYIPKDLDITAYLGTQKILRLMRVIMNGNICYVACEMEKK